MNAIDHLETLQTALPELFQQKDPTPDWDDGYILAPVSDPCYFTGEDTADFTDDEWLQPVDIGGITPSSLVDTEIVSVFGGSHAGAPMAFDPSSGTRPPLDALAFYLPFHYYYPNWWGIYIRVEGQAYLASEIGKIESGIPPHEAWAAARIFLYFHESFHHKVECFATRLEVTHRTALFKTGFEKYYQDTVLKSTCLEESLAEATALVQTEKFIRLSRHTSDIMKALVEIVRTSPPGYAEGADMVGSAFIAKRWEFAEHCQGYALPLLPKKPFEIWATANHMFDPLANIKSRVIYILPIKSCLAERLPMGRPLMSAAKLKKKIKKLKGLRRLTERDGRHPIYETSDGHRFPIPDHPGDMKRGTMANIIKQAGLDMSIREFQNA